MVDVLSFLDDNTDNIDFKKPVRVSVDLLARQC